MSKFQDGHRRHRTILLTFVEVIASQRCDVLGAQCSSPVLETTLLAVADITRTVYLLAHRWV